MSNDASSRAGRQTSGWAVGFILFAAIMMIMSGVFQALQGIIAIFENEFYVATRNYTFQFDATTWGWIHLLVGLLVAFAGYGLLSGKTWARLPEATSAHVLEPFYTTKPVGKGTGLGLGIGWRIVVRRHQGDLRFTSPPATPASRCCCPPHPKRVTPAPGLRPVRAGPRRGR